jgi:hypothetical protein
VLVAFFNPDVIIPPANVELGEQAMFSNSWDQFTDEQEGIFILDSPVVYFAVVLDGSQLSILFLDKEEGACDAGVRTNDGSSLQMFLEELFQGYSLILG